MCFNMQLQTERSLDPAIKYVQVRFDDSLYGFELTLRTNKCSLCYAAMLCYAPSSESIYSYNTINADHSATRQAADSSGAEMCGLLSGAF